MAKIHVIRHKVRADGLSQRQVARQLGISRNTVQRYLDDATVLGVRVEEERRVKPVIDVVAKDVYDILETTKQTAKQRLTSAGVVELLAKRGKVASGRTVRRLMREWRRKRGEVYIPLVYPPGDLAEVDFFEVVVVVAGVEKKAWMFVMRLMCSGRDFAWVYPWQDQAAFFDGHVRAFAHFGVVPKRILYDNLRAAVQKVLVGSERELNKRFAALAAHYAYGARFARPATGHDKGGVESRGKAIRWQHLTPVPEGPTLAEISQTMLDRLDQRMERSRRRGGPTIAALWEVERLEMLALPLTPHDPGVLYEVQVDGQSQIRVHAARYSVPCHWAMKGVRAWLYADTIVAVCEGERIERTRVAANDKNIQYRDYLPELVRKPGAIEQVGDELARQLGEPFDRVWRLLRANHGGQDAARRFRVVLELILRVGEARAATTLASALVSGVDVVLASRPAPVGQPSCVVPIALDRTVETSSLAIYDRLGGAR